MCWTPDIQLGYDTSCISKYGGLVGMYNTSTILDAKGSRDG